MSLGVSSLVRRTLRSLLALALTQCNPHQARSLVVQQEQLTETNPAVQPRPATASEPCATSMEAGQLEAEAQTLLAKAEEYELEAAEIWHGEIPPIPEKPVEEGARIQFSGLVFIMPRAPRVLMLCDFPIRILTRYSLPPGKEPFRAGEFVTGSGRAFRGGRELEIESLTSRDSDGECPADSMREQTQRAADKERLLEGAAEAREQSVEKRKRASELRAGVEAACQ